MSVHSEPSVLSIQESRIHRYKGAFRASVLSIIDSSTLDTKVECVQVGCIQKMFVECPQIRYSIRAVLCEQVSYEKKSDKQLHCEDITVDMRLRIVLDFARTGRPMQCDSKD